MRMRLALVPFVLGVLLTTAAGAQSPAAGDERRINSYTTGNQQRPRIAAGNAAGDFVVTWESYGQDGYSYGVYGQWEPGFGIIPPEFQANVGYTAGNEAQPDISMDAFSGDFVVVWGDAFGLGGGIQGARMSNGGYPLAPPFTVDFVLGGQDFAPRVAMTVGGYFVVAWTSSYGDGSGYGVFAQRFDSAASPVGGRVQVNTYTTSDQGFPAVAAAPAGNYVVVWQSFGEDGSGQGIFGQRFDNAGSALGGEFQVNTYTSGFQSYPAVAMDGSGNFIVVWTSEGQDGSGTGVFGQRFDASGGRLGPEFRVNTETASYQLAATVSAEPAGNFCVVWSSQATDGDGGISGRLFDAGGRPKGHEFPVNTFTTGIQTSPSAAFMGNISGNLQVTWQSDGRDGSQNGVASRSLLFDFAQPMAVDVHAAPGTSSNVNGVLEPGETIQLEPAWKNISTLPLAFSGAASTFTGPGAAVYTLDDTSAVYGTIAAGATANCYDGTVTHDCFMATVSGSRPVPHWDATFLETLNFPITKTWTLHVGGSFPDVPTSNLFYAFIENLFHNGITGGCGGGNYCPSSSVTRAQMAVFLLKAKHGDTFVPPACTGVFGDVACPSQFADWIEELYGEGITGGCGGGNYCPGNPVTRAQMAVFLLKAEHVAGYSPPACAGVFGDVACPSQFADWIERLAAENITGGCGGGNYCPNNPNTRGQMATFLVKTFGLLLYGP